MQSSLCNRAPAEFCALYNCKMETRLLARVTRQISKVRGGGRLTSLIVKRHRRISRPFVQHRVRGFVMHLDPHDFIDSEILFYSDQYERAELNFLSEHLKPGDTFADLGAHIGMHTLVASRAVGGAGLVISVEADPQTFRRLEGHLASNGVTNVRPFNYGVSDCEGLFTFYRCAQSIKNTGANSFLPRAERNWYPGFEMRCMTLRNLLKAGGAPRLDAVKLDLEGF